MLSVVAMLFAFDADACGVMFHDGDGYAESPDREIILEYGAADVVQITYRASIHSDQREFGWVIPIPGELVSADDGTDERFVTFNEISAPEFDEKPDKSIGCGSTAKVGDANGDGDVVVSEGVTGTYAYAELAADTSEPILTWIEDHQWPVGDAAAAIEEYVEEGGWHFLAVKVKVNSNQEYEINLPPLVIRYKGTTLTVPMRMSRYATDEQLSTRVYVVGDRRARILEGWTEVEQPVIHEPDADLQELWTTALTDAGSDQAFLTTFAGISDGKWVTRFDTIAEPADHTIDPIFLPDFGTTGVQTVVSNQTGCHAPAGAAILGLFPLWGWRRRRLAR